MSKEGDLFVKIQALLRIKAESNSEHEAALAGEHVQALLVKHNLSMDDVQKGSSSDGIVADEDCITDSRPWRRVLATVTAQLYFCDYFYGYIKADNPNRACGYTRYDRHTFVGARHNVAVSKMMFAYFCDAIDRLSNEAAKQVPPARRTPFINSFRHACADRLSDRILERYNAMREQKDSVKGNWLALYDNQRLAVENFMKQEYGDLEEDGKGRGVAKSNDMLGHRAGLQAGDSIGLDTQLEGDQGQTKRLT